MHEANPFVKVINYWLNGNVKDVSNVIYIIMSLHTAL